MKSRRLNIHNRRQFSLLPPANEKAVLTNFLPKCRAQNVDSEKGHGAGKKGMALEKKGMARRHSKSG